MKKFIIPAAAVAALTGAAVAFSAFSAPAPVKTQEMSTLSSPASTAPKSDCGGCADKGAVQASSINKSDCSGCPDKAMAAVDKSDCSSCPRNKPKSEDTQTNAVVSNGASYAKDGACASGSCGDKEAKVEAKVNGKTACCKSTAEKPMAKGDKGCCNAKGEAAKFKVWADGKYSFFGCEGSANKGRLELVAKGAMNVGKPQPVVGVVLMS